MYNEIMLSESCRSLDCNRSTHNNYCDVHVCVLTMNESYFMENLGSDFCWALHSAENWRDFFERPSAQERRRQEEAKKEEAENRGKPISLPPIQYIGDDIEMRPGDPGIRLLKMVTVQVHICLENNKINGRCLPRQLEIKRI